MWWQWAIMWKQFFTFRYFVISKVLMEKDYSDHKSLKATKLIFTNSSKSCNFLAFTANLILSNGNYKGYFDKSRCSFTRIISRCWKIIDHQITDKHDRIRTRNTLNENILEPQKRIKKVICSSIVWVRFDKSEVKAFWLFKF